MQQLVNLLFPSDEYSVNPIVPPIDICSNIEGLQDLIKAILKGHVHSSSIEVIDVILFYESALTCF